jgi:hypothetical protein
MPVAVSIYCVQRPELERELRTGAEKFFKGQPDNWSVSILGSQANTALRVKVTSPDGLRECTEWLYTEDGGRDFERVLAVAVEKIAA